MPEDLEEAAMDLGSTYVTTRRQVVVPIIFPAVDAAWLVAFTVSFDEFALALFLVGSEPTLPVYIFGQLQFASRPPMLVALVMLVMLSTLTLAVLAERLRRRKWDGFLDQILEDRERCLGYRLRVMGR
jgi:spermidine/putrescine transport system permease protein